MGSVLSSRRTAPASENRGLERAGDRSLYRYPPPNGGLYFANHYYLGHKRFDTGEPELFLFGDLQDVNYLPSKPIKFPYKQPSKNQPLKALRSYINIQRDSIKLVKAPDSDTLYSIQFTFDSDVDCSFLIWRHVEDTTSVDSLTNVDNLTRTEGMSEPVVGPFIYSAGSEQVFKEVGYCIDPASLLDGTEGIYDPAAGNHTVPIALVMLTDIKNGPTYMDQAQLSLCTLDKLNDGNYSIKIIKQKLLVDGMELLLQELYGLENKVKPGMEQKPSTKTEEEDDDDEEEDLGAECVICITDTRDTLLLPCRHLCLCNSCAASLRYQSSNCPICRAPFRALLQIKALQPLDPDEHVDDDTLTGNPKYAVPGYQSVPLLQALNGYQLETDHIDPVSMATSPGNVPQSPQQPASVPQTPTTEVQENTTEFCAAGVGCVASPTGEIVPSPSSDDTEQWTDPLRGATGTSNIKNQSVLATPTAPSIVVDIEGYGKVDEFISNSVQACGSSVSSEASIKSTDNLLHLANGKAHH